MNREPKRDKLPDLRPSITHHGAHGQMDFYVTVGFYDEPGRRTEPGEVFVIIAKEGSETRHMVNAWAQSVSVGLQYGVPWKKLADKIINTPGRPLIESVVHAVNRCIDQRISIIGEDDEPPTAGVTAPLVPTDPTLSPEKEPNVIQKAITEASNATITEA